MLSLETHRHLKKIHTVILRGQPECFEKYIFTHERHKSMPSLALPQME